MCPLARTANEARFATYAHYGQRRPSVLQTPADIKHKRAAMAKVWERMLFSGIYTPYLVRVSWPPAVSMRPWAGESASAHEKLLRCCGVPTQ